MNWARKTLLLLAAALLATGPAAAEDGPLFRYDGFDYATQDLPTALQQALFEAETQRYEALGAIADEGLFELHVLREAEQSGEEPDAVRAALLSVPPPDDNDIEAFYTANKSRIPAPLDQMRDQISRFLTEQTISARKSALVAEMKDDASFELLVPPPIPPRVEIDIEGYPFKGAAGAPVTVVEFSDFQCPHCKRASGVIRDIAKRYGDQIRLVYKDFPVNRSGISRLVARGAACAHEQGRFWEYHDLAFERQSELSESSPSMLADDVGLDMATFDRCYSSAESSDKVARSEAEAVRLGLSGTPTLFVDGRRLVLEDLEQDLPTAIDRALDGQG